MKQETIVQVFESWQNGNIAYAKNKIKRMTKAEFIDFIEHARSHNIMPYKLRCLV